MIARYAIQPARSLIDTVFVTDSRLKLLFTTVMYHLKLPLTIPTMHLIEGIEFVHAQCEVKVHNIMFESRRVARTYVSIFDSLSSYAVSDGSDLN